MEKMFKNKLLIVILSVAIIVAIGIAVAIFVNSGNINNGYENNMEQNQETQNIIYTENNKEENIIKVVIDNTQTEETAPKDNEINKNENTNNNVATNNNPSEQGGNMQNQENTSKYYIKINNEMNVVTIYQKDKTGKYTIPVKAMICSTGEATPTGGVYKISKRYVWRALQGNVYGQYAVRITGNILFHSVPYTAERKDALEWWEYDKLGTNASLGCIRLKVEDAKWIYDNCKNGTQVEFYYDSDPGPLGKPTAKKISSYSEELKNWDPTDPDVNNPWRTYKEPVEEIPVVENENKIEEEQSVEEIKNTEIIQNEIIEEIEQNEEEKRDTP